VRPALTWQAHSRARILAQKGQIMDNERAAIVAGEQEEELLVRYPSDCMNGEPHCASCGITVTMDNAVFEYDDMTRDCCKSCARDANLDLENRAQAAAYANSIL
jgi:hypothetical protein